MERLSNFRDTSRLTDCELLTDDDERISAHKVVIAAASPVMAACLERPMEESASGEIRLSGMTLPLARIFVNYLYTNKCDEWEEYAEELYEAADRFDIASLKVCKSNSASPLN